MRPVADGLPCFQPKTTLPCFQPPPLIEKELSTKREEGKQRGRERKKREREKERELKEDPRASRPRR